MKSSLNFIVFFAIVILTQLLAGCSGCKQNKNTLGDKVNFEDINIIDTLDAVIMALPSPEEILEYIKSNNVSFDNTLLSKNEITQKALNNTQKKITLGMYLADLAYLSSFSKSEYLSEYMHLIDELLKDLELTPIVSKELRSKLIDSDLNPQDIYQIVNQLHDSVINYLYDVDDGKTLTLISIGTFCEIIYVSVNLHNDYDLFAESATKITEQKLIYDDLLSMTNSFKDKELQEFYEKLSVLNNHFASMNFDSEIISSETSEDSTLIINSLTTSELSKEKYTDFTKAVNQLRSDLLN
ncbi:hypothetical protein [Carboxylicivirga caseinilyticus]|uniref:hypothetical protein n=1 Tax=Carboxylicivirga caseinilyticus TaxID=3417572 RepID=UPI003D3269DB|nr:hypothetical protein [Marinilabiliaceae bacterium A049]